VLSSAFYLDKSRARREAAADFFRSVIFFAESTGVMNACMHGGRGEWALAWDSVAPLRYTMPWREDEL
jgi:hypothetical protein